MTRQRVAQDHLSAQSAFVKGRFILDSFVTASELISWGVNKHIDCVGVKADFEKAFDHVNWGFLKHILRCLGANQKWCGWIEQCISNGKIAILVNGTPTNWFKMKRGLRQGDPLSQFLYLLVAEGLARMTNRAVQNNLLKGVGPLRDAKTSLIQFADDTIFFCEAKVRQIRNLRFMWQTFEWASGLKINRTKSELFYLGNGNHKGERLAAALDCKLGSLPIKYLGLPLKKGSIPKEDWHHIINRIKQRIAGWQAKLLSQGGWLILVNSVLSNLPLYYFSVFRAPVWVLKRIDSLRRAFFWKGRSSVSGGNCLVSWKTVCRSKRDGGLGVLNLESMNTALLAKWWWRYFSADKTPWGPLVKGLYYQRRRPLNEGSSFKPFSHWWTSMLGTRELFKCGTTRSVGDGDLTGFWSDIWIGNSPLSTQFSCIFELVCNKNLRVKDCYERNGWNWEKILEGIRPGQIDLDATIQNLKATAPNLPLTNCKDVFHWRWTTSRLFSVKSLYRFLQDSGEVDSRFDNIWKIKSPLKVKIFVWLVLRRRVLTRDNLLKRNWGGPSCCVICLGPEESANHLFVSCTSAQALLETLLPNKLEIRNSSTVDRLWEAHALKKGGLGNRALITIAAT